MNLSELSMRHWPSMAVAVAPATLFGALAIHRRPIRLLTTVEQPQVTTLREGDRDAIRGAENLTDGAAVRVVLSDASAADDG